MKDNKKKKQKIASRKRSANLENKMTEYETNKKYKKQKNVSYEKQFLKKKVNSYSICRNRN